MKNFLILVAIFSLFLSSCCCEDHNEASPQMPQEVKQETKITKKEIGKKSGVVHRIYINQFRTSNTFYVRLKNGKVLEGSVGVGLGEGMDQPEDFYFVRPGDTIFYDGDDVISVSFKD